MEDNWHLQKWMTLRLMGIFKRQEVYSCRSSWMYQENNTLYTQRNIIKKWWSTAWRLLKSFMIVGTGACHETRGKMVWNRCLGWSSYAEDI